MKIITIGDIHGRNVWKQALEKEADLYIFLGDYLDADISMPTPQLPQVIPNFKEMVEAKIKNPDKIILLLGNHDIHYRWYPKHICARFMRPQADYLHNYFVEHRSLFQSAFQIQNYLWTHAGLSQSFLQALWAKFPERFEDNSKPLADIIEDMMKVETERDFLAIPGKSRGGYYAHGGIFWADFSETFNDMAENLHQYVGHSRMPGGIMTFGDEHKSITYCDCLNVKVEFHEMNIGV